MKTFKIEMAMEKCFKQLLDGLEVSKNLAEFTDFTIKGCIPSSIQAQDSNWMRRPAMQDSKTCCFC